MVYELHLNKTAWEKIPPFLLKEALGLDSDFGPD